MKSSEHIVSAQGLLAAPRFGSKTGRGVEDATAPLITFVLRHLEAIKNRAHRLFDFSSFLNRIQPHVLAQFIYLDFSTALVH